MNERNTVSAIAARAFAVLLLVPAAIGAAFAAEAEPLTLRVQDAIGAPGGMISVVMRTYASRPIGQGQVCLVADPTSPTNPPAAGALDSLESAIVLSDFGDVATEVTFDGTGDPQVILLQFTSPSASVNNTDGPLAALFFRLADNVLPGETFELVVDTENTLLYDENGAPIEIRPRFGELTVRAPSDPHQIAVDAGRVRPGDVVTLAIQSLEPFPISSGRVALRYDPTIAASRPAVRMDPRHGLASFVSDTSIPGLVIVDFESPGAALNSLPGDLIELTFVTSKNMPDGTAVTLSLDPALTYLDDAGGQLLPIFLESDELLFVGEPFRGGRHHVETFGPPIDARRVDISQ